MLGLTWSKRRTRLLLDGAQVRSQSACIFRAETKCRHIRVAAHQALAQLPGEPIQINAAIEVAKCRGGTMSARSDPSDCVALGAHALGQCKPVALQLTEGISVSKRGGSTEQGAG